MSLGAFWRCLTTNKKGLRTSNYATDYIYQGKCFSVAQRITVEAATNTFILFDISNCHSKEITVYTPVFEATTGPLEIDYYSGTNYTGGTPMLVNNRASYGESNQCALTIGATGTNKGTKFTEGFVSAGHKSGAASQGGLEFIPPQDTKLLVEINNTNGTDATVFINFVWFEV